MYNSLSLYLITVLIWGTSWYAIKFQLGVVAPEVSLFYRFGLASVLLIGFCLGTGRSLGLGFSGHMFVAAQGVFLFSLNYLVFYIATPMLVSGLIAVVFSSIILMNMVNGAIFLGKSVEPKVFVGALFGLTGITMVFWPEVSGNVDSPRIISGLLLSLLATYFASLGNILSARNQKKGIPVIQANALGMGYGALFMLIVSLARGLEFNFEWTQLYVGSLVYLSVFASILAFGAYLTLIGRIGADRAAYATVLFPIVALGISSVFESFSWTLLSLSGVACVLTGNLLVTGLGFRGRPERA